MQKVSTQSSGTWLLVGSLNLHTMHVVWLILIIGILIRIPLVLIPAGAGFQHTTWRQTDTASIAHNFVDEHDLLFPRIHWGGSGPGYVETEFQLYPYITSILYQLFGENIGWGLLTSLVFSTGTLIVFFQLARRILPIREAVFALGFFAFAPMFIHYSVVFMPEPAVMFFYVAALFLFQKWLDEEKVTDLALLTISTALAILIKPTSIHIGFVFLVLLLMKYGLRVFTRWQIWAFAIFSLLPGIIWYLHARNLYLTYGNTFGIISGGDSKFDNLRYWFSVHFYATVFTTDLYWVSAIGGFLPFCVGLYITWRNRHLYLILAGLASIVIYYLLIPRYVSFAVYYHIFALPYAALAVGLGFVYWLNNLRRPMLPKIPILNYGLLVVVVVQMVYAVFAIYRQELTIETQPYRECGQQVASLVPEKSLVIISTTTGAFDAGTPNNYQEPDIFFYSNRYGWSLPYEWHNPETVEMFRADGAQYFVIYAPELLEENPPLAAYLENNAVQIGPGAAAQCGIYQFKEAQS